MIAQTNMALNVVPFIRSPVKMTVMKNYAGKLSVRVYQGEGYTQTIVRSTDALADLVERTFGPMEDERNVH